MLKRGRGKITNLAKNSCVTYFMLNPTPEKFPEILLRQEKMSNGMGLKAKEGGGETMHLDNQHLPSYIRSWGRFL